MAQPTGKELNDMDIGDRVTVKAGWGWHDVTTAPLGCWFRRKPVDLHGTVEDPTPAKQLVIIRLETGERAAVDPRAVVLAQ